VIHVEVVHVDLDRRELDFRLVKTAKKKSSSAGDRPTKKRASSNSEKPCKTTKRKTTKKKGKAPRKGKRS
jgi:hypothetical protein